MSKAAAVKPVQLDDKQTKQFDQLIKLEAQAKKLRRAEKRASKVRKELEEIFGKAFLATTADGRLIQRTPHSREYAPLPAKTASWNEFQEIEAW